MDDAECAGGGAGRRMRGAVMHNGPLSAQPGEACKRRSRTSYKRGADAVHRSGTQWLSSGAGTATAETRARGRHSDAPGDLGGVDGRSAAGDVYEEQRVS